MRTGVEHANLAEGLDGEASGISRTNRWWSQSGVPCSCNGYTLEHLENDPLAQFTHKTVVGHRVSEDLLLAATCRPSGVMATYCRHLAKWSNHQGSLRNLPSVLNDTSVNAKRKAIKPYRNQTCDRFTTSRKRKRLTEIFTTHCPTVTHIMCT